MEVVEEEVAEMAAPITKPIRAEVVVAGITTVDPNPKKRYINLPHTPRVGQ